MATPRTNSQTPFHNDIPSTLPQHHHHSHHVSHKTKPIPKLNSQKLPKYPSLREIFAVIDNVHIASTSGVSSHVSIGRQIDYFNPIAILDHFFIPLISKSDETTESKKQLTYLQDFDKQSNQHSAGFHPHRGLIILRYIFPHSYLKSASSNLEKKLSHTSTGSEFNENYALLHKDNLGGENVIFPGGLCSMVAGKGIVHSELPHIPLDHSKDSSSGRDSLNNNNETTKQMNQEFVNNENSNSNTIPPTKGVEGIQIWVNLPQSIKMCQPSVQVAQLESIPTFLLQNSKILARILIGSEYGFTNPISNVTPMKLIHYTLPPDSILTIEHASHDFNHTIQPYNVSHQHESQQKLQNQSQSSQQPQLTTQNLKINKEWNVFAYIINGFGQINEQPVLPMQTILFTKGISTTDSNLNEQQPQSDQQQHCLVDSTYYPNSTQYTNQPSSSFKPISSTSTSNLSTEAQNTAIIISTKNESQYLDFILCASQCHSTAEKVYPYGPVILNSKSEVQQFYADLASQKNGFEGYHNFVKNQKK